MSSGMTFAILFYMPVRTAAPWASEKVNAMTSAATTTNRSQIVVRSVLGLPKSTRRYGLLVWGGIIVPHGPFLDPLFANAIPMPDVLLRGRLVTVGTTAR